MKCVTKYSKQEILEACQAGGLKKEKMIMHVGEELGRCKAFHRSAFKSVRSKGKINQDAEDLIQDSILQVLISLTQNKYKGSSSIENFAMGILKNKLMNLNTKKIAKPLKDLPDRGEENLEHHKNDAEKQNVEETYILKERNKVLISFVERLGEDCKAVLSLWSKNYAHKEIEEILQIPESRSRKLTVSCKKKLKALIAEHPQYQDLLKYTSGE